jgi:hypothetical protein
MPIGARMKSRGHGARALRITKLRLDFQPAKNLIDEWVADYVTKLRRREKVEPVIVYFDGVDYYLFDGFHRVEAAKRIGRTTILAEVRSGTLADMEAEWRRGLEEIKKDLRREPGSQKAERE